jgi:hypothetical protein
VDGAENSRVRRIAGSIADPEVVARVFDAPMDMLFHLASIPGGMAERDYEEPQFPIFGHPSPDCPWRIGNATGQGLGRLGVPRITR